MKSKQFRIVIAIYIITAFLIFMLHVAASAPVESRIKPYLDDLDFNATRAYDYAYTLAKNFPYRPTGSEGAHEAFKWIRSELEKLGYETHVQEFDVTLVEPKRGRNVYAILRGEIEEAIGVLVNYDMAPTSVEAASDTAGHVGVLLELANALRYYDNRRSIVFAFVDSEEWGMQGAKYFVENYAGPPLRTVIVAEDLTVGNLTSIYLESMGQFRGYSPLWLRLLCRDVGKALNIPVIDPVGFEEYILRTVRISFTDQGPILAKGISSIEVSTRGDSPELARNVYHTPEDRMENMRTSSFETYGMYTKALLLSLDKADEIPDYEPDYLMVEDGRYLSGPFTYLAPAMLLLPLLLYLSYERKDRREIVMGLLVIVGCFSGLVVGFVLVVLSPTLGVIPAYDTYPPPPRHPFLYSPNPLLFALFLTPPVAATILLNRKVRDKRPSTAAVLLVLILSVLLSMYYNHYATVTLLSQAIFLWPWIPYIRRRIIKVVLLLGGMSVFLLLLIQFGEIIFLGPLITWYLLLGAAYGQFSMTGNVIFSLVAAVALYLAMNRAPIERSRV